MASTGINFVNLTPDNGAIRDLRELIFRAVLDGEKLGSMFNVMPNQKHGDKVGFIGEFGLVGKASQGCDPVYANTVLAANEKTWDIKAWEIAESICYKDLEGTLASVALRTKTSIADLTGTEYLDYVLQPRLEVAVRKMLHRLAWFGDKAAANVSAGGVLAAGVDPAYFNVTDGYWKHIFTGVSSKAIKHVEIAANAEDTFAEQEGKILEAGVATGIVDRLIMRAPMVLRQAPEQVIYLTQSLRDALDYDLVHNNKGSELQWKTLFDGVTEATYKGVTVRAIPFWDEAIRSWEGDGNAWNKPHRAIYTIKDNLLLGLESTDEIAEIVTFFDMKDKKNYIRVEDKLGTLIADENLIHVAY